MSHFAESLIMHMLIHLRYTHTDTSVKSEDESLTMDSHESISQSLAERFDRLPRLPSSPPLSPAEPAPQRDNVVR